MIPESEIIFKVSGSALSFLYYECDKSRLDQVGFLIGEKHSFVKKTISDSQMNGEKNETIINIVAVLPVGTPFSFCNNVGRVDRMKLKTLLGPLAKDVCGWYIFRRNSGLSPLLRGTMIHRELLDAIPHALPQSFVLCCIGSDTSSSLSTHRYKHVFLLHKNRIFEPISARIINLGQPEDTGYRTAATTTSSNASFNEIVSSLNSNNEQGGLLALKALQKPLQEKIMQIASQVQQYDKKAQKLISEIDEIRHNKLLMSKLKNNMVTNAKPHEVGSEGDIDKKDDKRNEEEKDQEPVNVDDDDDLKDKDNKSVAKESSQEIKNSDSSEEIVCSSQIVDDSKSIIKKEEKSFDSGSPQPSNKINDEESNSYPGSPSFTMSEEY